MQLSNLDMAAAKQIFSKVMPHLPVRVGRICVYSPPWIVGKVCPGASWLSLATVHALCDSCHSLRTLGSREMVLPLRKCCTARDL